MEKHLVLAVCYCIVAGYVDRDIDVPSKTVLQNTSTQISLVSSGWFVLQLMQN